MLWVLTVSPPAARAQGSGPGRRWGAVANIGDDAPEWACIIQKDYCFAKDMNLGYVFSDHLLILFDNWNAIAFIDKNRHE